MPYPEMDAILLVAILQLFGVVILAACLVALVVHWLW